MKTIVNEKFSYERALYNLKDTKLINVSFEGKEDGESALKEARNISLDNCLFSLRYPLWHVDKFNMNKCEMKETCRAGIWYSNNIFINNTTINGVKAVRECKNGVIENSNINSVEFGWKCNLITLTSSELVSEYAFLDSKNIKLNNVKFKGKYSFQYVQDLEIYNSYLDTKDAFWHAKNVKVVSSVIKGEYLGWYSENLTLINCKIIGTQPLCYCKNLIMIDCEMVDTDNAFEYSSVNATIRGEVESIKNPYSGLIRAEKVKQIIIDNDIKQGNCEIIVGTKKYFN